MRLLEARLDTQMSHDEISQEEISSSNLLQSLLTMYIHFKLLQDKVNQNPRCLLSNKVSSFTVHSPLLGQFSKHVMAMLKSVEGSLNGLAPNSEGASEVTDAAWFKLQTFFYWFFELCHLGLEVPGNNNLTCALKFKIDNDIFEAQYFT